MPLRPCPECKTEVSTKAPTCPRCGAPIAKVRKQKAAQQGCAGVILLTIGLIVIGFFASQNDQKTGSAPNNDDAKAQEQSEAECAQDLHCYAEKAYVGAGIFCKEPIEKLSKYDVKWTDAWYEPKFESAKWLDKADGTLTMRGDKAEFQNGFGAFEKVTYECDYNPKTHEVLDVRVDEEK